MMRDALPNIREALRLCEDALAGTLTLDRFYSEWPEQWNADSFFRAIYENLEDRVEHLPEEFAHSYLALCLDILLLKRLIEKGGTTDTLLRCRNHVLSDREITEEALSERVQECIRKENGA